MKKRLLPFWLIFLSLLVVSCAPLAPEPTRSILATPTDAGSPAPSPTAQETPTEEAYPPPPSATPFPVTEPPLPTEFPTPTEPPVPTRMTTPDVTPLPTAEPPIIPIPPSTTPEPFTLIYRNDQTLQAVESDGNDDRVLADLPTDLSLYFIPRGVAFGAWTIWATPSPDRKQLALVLSTIADAEPPHPPLNLFIYLLDLETGEFRLLVEEGVEPAWSPDGSEIAYRNLLTGALWIIDVASGQTREIYATGNNHYVSNMSWAPDGQRLVFVDNVYRESTAITVVNADGTGTATILIPEGSVEERNWARVPEWSPDGSLIMFAWSMGQGSGPEIRNNLWVMHPDGTNQTQLTQDINVLSGGIPHWSPDGNWIVFAGTPSYEALESNTDIWLVDKTGTSLKRLTYTEASNEVTPMWSTDGTHIVFQRSVDESWESWVLSLINGSQAQVPLLTSDFVPGLITP